MTIINSVGNSLTGATGTGEFVGQNSPTLITPNLGVPNTLILANTSTVSSATTITLTAASTYNQTITGSHTQIIKMPVVTSLQLTQAYQIINDSTATITVQSSGSNNIAYVYAGFSLIVQCVLITGTTAASWMVAPSMEVAGDTGTGKGNNMLITSNGGCGATVGFNVGGNTNQIDIFLQVSDSSNNTIEGFLAGTGSIGGTNNNGFGAYVLSGLNGTGGSTASFNTAMGWDSLNSTGAGSVYSVESNNIAINHQGVVSDAGVIRIGQNSVQSSCYIGGINNTNSSGFTTPQAVYVDSSTGQLGYSNTLITAPTDSHTSTTGFGSLVVGTAQQNTLGYDILVNVSMAVTAATGATVVLGVGSTSTPTTDTVVASFSVAETVSFTAIVPSGYYCLVNTTGTIVVGSITTQVCPI